MPKIALSSRNLIVIPLPLANLHQSRLLISKAAKLLQHFTAYSVGIGKGITHVDPKTICSEMLSVLECRMGISLSILEAFYDMDRRVLIGC